MEATFSEPFLVEQAVVVVAAFEVAVSSDCSAVVAAAAVNQA